MFLKVDSVVHLRNYELRVLFNNGIVKDVELGCELDDEEFRALRDPRLFARVTANARTGALEWPNGADLSPEFLFDVGRSVKPAA